MCQHKIYQWYFLNCPPDLYPACTIKFTLKPQMKRDQVSQAIRDAIIRGDFPRGALLPSERQLAIQFGISRLTLRRAIEPLVKDGTLENQPGRGTLVPDQAADDSTRLPWKIVALVLPDISNRFFAEVAESVEYAALQQGYQILLCNSRHQSHLEDFHLRQLAEHGVDGVLFAHDPHLEMPRAFERLEAAGIPTVLLFASQRPAHCDVITLDDRSGVEQGLRYLTSLGHRHIGFVRPLEPGLIHEREKHYLEFLRQHSLTINPSHTIDILDRPEEEVRQQLQQLHSGKSSTGPTAYLCGNDRVALMLMRQTGAIGLRIPEDISIVGFDNLRFVEHLAVPLTTVDQPKHEMGRRAAEMLFERINARNQIKPRHEVFRPHLIIRDSCAVPRA